jgi:drug/metabolite transporter (DMT)-like permease
MYLLYAILGCVFFASGGILRVYQGSDVFIANSIITLSFLVTALTHFFISALKKKARGEKYLFPWQIKGDTVYGEIIVTDKQLLIWMIVGGTLEFVGGQAMAVSYNGALSAGMNGGMCGAIIAMNTVFVLICAFFLFNERLNKTKFLAMAMLITAVIMVSLFMPDDLIINMPEVSGRGTDDIITKNLPKLENELFFNQLLLIIGGLVASLSFGS